MCTFYLSNSHQPVVILQLEQRNANGMYARLRACEDYQAICSTASMDALADTMEQIPWPLAMPLVPMNSYDECDDHHENRCNLYYRKYNLFWYMVMYIYVQI